MPSLPRRSVKGAIFKKWVVESIDQIIDYLTSNWLQAGNGINIRRTPSGTIVELQKMNTAPQTSGSGGGGGGIVQNISATVSGGTASLALSGSTSSVNFVGTGDVTISGNTNTGNIEINATGGGGGGTAAVFPDLSNPIEDMEFDVTHAAYSYPVWLIGSIGVDNSIVGNTVVCSVVVGDNGVNVYAWSDSTPPNGTLYVPFSFLVPANKTFELSTYSTGTPTDLKGTVTIYPCIGQTPLADYTVTRATGTTNGSLFYGLSQQGDNTVSVDQSLNGTPIDFEGASVL
jgi:hypothetical protein